jgi:hypothetical protein
MRKRWPNPPASKEPHPLKDSSLTGNTIVESEKHWPLLQAQVRSPLRHYQRLQVRVRRGYGRAPLDALDGHLATVVDARWRRYMRA